MQKIKGLFRRNTGIFYLRLLRPKEIWISLRTRDAYRAMMVAIRIIAEVDMDDEKKVFEETLEKLKKGKVRDYTIDIKKGIYKADGPEDQKAMERTLTLINSNPKLLEAMMGTTDSAEKKYPELTLKEAFEDYILNCVTKRNAPRTIDSKTYHLENLVGFFGGEKHVDDIDKTVITDFKKHSLGAGKSPKTVDNHLLTYSDFFNFLIKNGYCNHRENPISGMYIESKSEREKNADSYDLFTDEEHNLIFEPNSYLSTMTMPDFYWVPLIAYYTGMRISEIGCLRVEDFRKQDGFDYIYVKDSKTKNGIRPVPIHSELKALGLLDYVEDVKRLGKSSLFPFRTQTHKRIHKRAQEVFADYRAKLGIDSTNKSMHSFRVGFITRLVDEAGDQTVQIRRITGHATDKSNGAKVQDGYVRGLSSLVALVEKFRCKEFSLDIAQLKYQPGGFSKIIAMPPPAPIKKKGSETAAPTSSKKTIPKKSQTKKPTRSATAKKKA